MPTASARKGRGFEGRIPNPVHLVDGQITVSHIDISKHVDTIKSMFADATNTTRSPFAFDDGGKMGRQTIECTTRNDTTNQLYMALDAFTLTTLEQWGSDYYGGVSREQFMLYPVGSTHPLHVDDQNPVPDHVGRTKYLMNLMNQVASLLYVTEDLEGGEIVFPDQGLEIPVTTGTLVCFPSNYKFPHSVNAVQSGIRIAIARHYFVKDMEYV